MIDIHTHPCELRDDATYHHFNETGKIPAAAIAPYLEAISDVDKAVALAFWAPASHIEVSNDFIAEVVRHEPDKIVGFACVDPKSPGAMAELDRSINELGMKGLKLGPIYQHFAPDDPACWPLYARVQELGLPILWHQGTSFMAPEGPLEDAHPYRLDKVIRAFPNIKMIIAHFGYPWPREVVALMGRHPHVYTDISVLANRPWFLYNALIDALEYGTQDKILLGSDYPAFTARETVAALRKINDFARGTSLPVVPATLIEEIIERDSLALVGITA